MMSYEEAKMKPTQPFTQRRHFQVADADRTYCGIPVLELRLECRTLVKENVTCEECKKKLGGKPIA